MNGVSEALEQLRSGMVLVVYAKDDRGCFTPRYALREEDMPWGCCGERRTIMVHRGLMADGSYDLNTDWEPADDLLLGLLATSDEWRMECEDEDR